MSEHKMRQDSSQPISSINQDPRITTCIMTFRKNVILKLPVKNWLYYDGEISFMIVLWITDANKSGTNQEQRFSMPKQMKTRSIIAPVYSYQENQQLKKCSKTMKWV